MVCRMLLSAGLTRRLLVRGLVLGGKLGQGLGALEVVWQLPSSRDRLIGVAVAVAGGLRLLGLNGCPFLPFPCCPYLVYWLMHSRGRVLESIRAEKRLSEARFALSLAPKSQPIVSEMFR